MANLSESAAFDAGIYRIETTDAVVGGETGIANKSAKGLANRTAYLKQHLDAAEATILTYGTALTDHESRIGALEASRVHTLGTNYSRGFVTINSGSPFAVGATDYGKLITIDPNINTLTVRMPTLTGILDGAIFDFVIAASSSTYFNCKVLFTSFDGSIIGDTNDFTEGDMLRIVRKNSTQWQLIVFHKKNASAIGKVEYFATSTPPAGYIAADGAAISRTTYARLFSVIGVQNGVGNGTTTFNVPDGRGVFIRGWDNGRGQDPSRVFAQYQADDFKSHTHDAINTNNLGSVLGRWNWADRGDNSSDTGNQVSATGGTETRPKNIALLACIKY
jgi:microcystin-dependent protein